MELDSLIPKLWLSRVEGHFQLSVLWLQLVISCRSLCKLTLEGFGKQAENPTDIPHPMGSWAQGGFCEDFVRTGGRGGNPCLVSHPATSTPSSDASQVLLPG